MVAIGKADFGISIEDGEYQRRGPAHPMTDQLTRKDTKALIIGAESQRVDLLKRHLSEYFDRTDLMTESGRLYSLAADSHPVIVVTDTLGDTLDRDFFSNLRSHHPRARLLCLVNHLSRDAEKVMRSAGLLFLGSYDHFDVCYASILQTALSQLKPMKRQLSQRAGPS